MEYFLLIIGFCCMLLGILGSLLPALPGPPISWIGLLLLYLSPGMEKNYWVLGITLVIAIIITILDYIIPAKGTKRFGGSKYGIWGTNIGLIVGIFAPIPFGFIIGPFVGAFIGELLYDRKDSTRATKAAIGSFLGFLTGTFIKLLVTISFLVLYVTLFFENKNIWI